MRVIRVDMPVEGVLRVWWAGDHRWLEVRGEYNSDPDDDFQRVLDAMPGSHACVLWTDSVLDVLPTHPDYDMFRRLLAEG